MTNSEKNRLIEAFMGWELVWVSEEDMKASGWQFVNSITKERIYKTTYNSSTIGFTTDWNRLMEALKKFDNLSISNWEIERYSEYAKVCDQIDYAVTLYNIDDAVNALCEGIEWYNSTLN